MPNHDRKELILETMRRRGRFVTVEQLCETLFVSGATIRRDLSELEAGRLIRRTRGGAILVEGSANDEPMDLRENRNVMQKQIIASLARRHIRDGMTLFMDASSTVLTLARNLDGFSNLRVITNGVKTALLLSGAPNVQVMCTGGMVREGSKSLVGQGAVDFIARLNADIAFMSCRGFSIKNGASEASEGEYAVKRQFMQNSKKSILLCDSSKLNEDFLCRLAPLRRFAGVITERRDLNELCKKAMASEKG